MFTKFCDIISNIIYKLIMVVMALLVVVVVWQVFSRFVLRNPSTITEEISRYSLIWVGFLGSAYAFYKCEHMALTILPNKLKGAAGLALSLVIHTCVLVLMISVMIFGGSHIMNVSSGQTSAILKLSMPIVYSVIPISGVATVIFTINNIVHDIGKFTGKQQSN